MSFHRPGSTAAPRGRRTIVLLAALFLLALVVAWMRGSATDVATPETATRGSARVEALVAPNGGTADERHAAIEEGGPIDERAFVAENADATPREAIDVLVRDLRTGKPVAGAEVLWANAAEIGLPADPAEYGVISCGPTESESPDRAPLPENARRTTTDEHGLARIDARVFPGRIVARSVDRFGSVDVDARHASPIRVHVDALRAVSIQVVDEAGTPVSGVPVSLRREPKMDRTAAVWRGTTGEDGIARAELVQPRMIDEDVRTIHACLEVPLLREVIAPVDLSKPFVDTVRLVLPPCGSVVVGVREAEGRAARRFDVRLRCTTSGTQPDFEYFEAETYAFRPARKHEHEAFFPFVGLGLDVYPVASRRNADARQALPGPRAAGDVVRFDLELEGREPVVIGRLLTDAGAPLRERLVQIVFGSTQGSSFRYPLLTDADGRFRFSATVPERPGMTGSLLAMPIGIGIGEGGAADIAIDVESTDAPHDVGDLVVRSQRLVASGIVVDDAGAAVPWPDVVVFAPCAVIAGEEWRSDSRAWTVPHADGRFEVLTSLDVERIRLFARPPGHVASEAAVIGAGTRDVRLVAPRGGEIGGRVIVDDGIDVNRIRVLAIGPGSRDEGRVPPQSHAAWNAFLIRFVAPGRYDLEFVHGKDETPFHRIEGVEVPPGGRATDARLDAIALRGKIAPSTRR